MQRIISYGPTELTRGKCTSCGEKSSEILIGDGRCVDCKEAIEFEETCDKMFVESGTCKICGCTDEDACYDVEYGACSWVDETMTLCSHCAGPEDPDSLAAIKLASIEMFDE